MIGTNLIDLYIRETKLNCEERISEPLYAALRGSVFDVFVDRFQLKAGFRVVYSPSRRAERLIFSDETWLIYDQYLGQTLNTLNRILIETTGDHPAIVYFNKYIAERCVEYGCPTLGIYLSNFFRQGREATRGSGKPDPLRLAYTIMQEQFAIFHELAHEAQGSNHNSVTTLASIVAENIEERRQWFTSTDQETLIKDFRECSSAAYHDQNLEDFLSEVLEFYSSESGEENRKGYLRALDDPETARELFCDFLATEFVLQSVGNSAQDIDSAIRALYVGSYHLKTLTYVDFHLEHLLLHKTPAPLKASYNYHRIQTIQVRNHCFKSHLLFIYGSRLRATGTADVDELVSDLNETLMMDQKLYYERIFDPMAKLLGFVSEAGRLEELALESLKPLEEVGDPGEVNLIANLVILQNTGWPLSFAARFFPTQR